MRLVWKTGEEGDFLRTLASAKSFDFYVPAEEQQRIKSEGARLSEADWRALIESSAYYRDLLVLHAPQDLAISLLLEAAEESASAYIPLKGAIAKFGEAAIPIAIGKLRHVAQMADEEVYASAVATTVEACAPIADPAIAPLLEAVERSKCKRKARRHIAAWRKRHL